MALGLTQPLTEMSTRNISWRKGKGSRCVGLTTLPPLDIWEPQPPETVWACPGLHRDCFPFTFYPVNTNANHAEISKEICDNSLL